MQKKITDEAFMKQALELARKGLGGTSPNPCVGAVIVKGGRIVAEGYHQKAGQDHAEIMAIKQMMLKSGIRVVDIDPALFRNATLYVTLEPCCHSGKTPPCVKTLIRAGFQKIVVGMKDPFKKVNGRGIAYLRKHGIKVSLLRQNSKIHKAVRSLNQPFIKSVATGLPYVILKAGLSLDGKIATVGGNSKWITGEKARADAGLERKKCDVVMVGSGTIAADNPELNGGLRIIVDNKLSLDVKSKVFRDENVLVACSDLAGLKNRKRFELAGIKFRSFGKDRVSIKKLLKYLGKNGIQSVFLEGGSGLNAAFFEENQQNSVMIDKILFYFAPKLIGGRDSLAVIGGRGVDKLSLALRIREPHVESIGDDLKYEGVINFY
ncbi:bifunctional diaminohydroxyphosphoribosylaminopyrimidine deaminase/5-amino-6-(5-phosphoribosylamino)uracil reductase RibD [Candidatus Peregrinibacteria bacterium]|nr:bifunctional diaminohydroxyphosphoribosylaminopyrimidine deaminase/5-amino-6-(5-phosphoribosylamino)uracil reductase RibD [Candidatus Peregrinibacteria bacterium]